MSQVEKYRPYYTYEDYLGWEGRWELIDGLPYAMSPSPNGKHQRTVMRLGQFFLNSIEEVECATCQVYDFFDWKIAENTVLQPDVLVVCKPLENENYLSFPPELVIEILSPSTALKDRREKFEIYQQQRVKYYIIVDPAFNKIEIFYCNNSLYEIAAVSPTSFLFDLSGCSVTVNFSKLFK